MRGLRMEGDSRRVVSVRGVIVVASGMRDLVVGEYRERIARSR